MPGHTAWSGLLKIGEPKPGETVFVSGAAGAVGSLVGQIAKIKGCHVVGSAGGKDKCDYLKSIGFDEAIDYRAAGDLRGLTKALQHAAPKGVDVYFDNVGGDHLTAAIACATGNPNPSYKEGYAKTAADFVSPGRSASGT
jgi:NADPH-dependent curcumin reductase CurA